MRRALAIAAVAGLGLGGCKDKPAAGGSAAPAGAPVFQDDFERKELGPNWFNTGAPWADSNGQLTVVYAHNHPLWLTQPLPRDVRIEFDCASHSPSGDIKVEVFGDGQKHATDEEVAKDLQYTASGYVFLFGGWNNSRSAIVKQQEHEWQYKRGVPLRMDKRVEPFRTYHWTIERKGTRLTWLIDGEPFLTRDDPQPLEGPGHDRFAFDGWEAELVFDNLKITPL